MTQPDLPWTRRAFSDLFIQSREWLTAQFIEAGLQPRLDAAGNLIGRRNGSDTSAKPIITGSHCDTVMSGGRFDGIIGVLAGVEIAHTLHEQNIELVHPFEVIDFLSEEPSDYGVSCVGSRGYAGMLSKAMLNERNPQGETLAQGIARIGGDPRMLSAPLHGRDDTAAFVELHIEQGPVLETRKLPIGIVTDIVGIRRFRITVEGRPDHAGTTPMNIRRDALVGASRIIDKVDAYARAWLNSEHYVVATVGHMLLTPNASNAVPGHVELMLEVRSNTRAALDVFVNEVLADVRPSVESLGLVLASAEVSDSQPTACTPFMIDLIEEAAEELSLASMRMTSGAGHDAVYMAKTGPMGMIFIPCLGGRSHCPEEWIEPEQLLDGTKVLYQTIRKLDDVL